MSPVRSTALPLALALVAASAIGGLVYSAPHEAPPLTLTAGGNGATVPFTEYEAESAATNGAKIGPDYTQGSLPSEASGRQAVTLSGQGKYVEFTLTKPANSIVLRYSVPDGSQGTVSVQVNGTKVRDLVVTSKYSWLTAPWIAGAKEHHFYDESRALLGRDAVAGDRVRVQLDAGNVSTATVDLADFEQVAGAAGQPANSLSVTNYGATPNDGGDDANAFVTTINAAKSQGREVWVPPGTFDIGRGLPIDQVTIRGAGAWHSVLHSNNPFLNNGQVQGGIKLYDFAIMGEVTQRVDNNPDNAYHGPLGSGSVISGLWMQHLKCGIWTMNGTTNGAVIENNRFLDLAADGLNFNGRVTDSVVRNNFLRNTGDDSLAMWSLGGADVRDSFTNNTIVQPNLANGIAIYGGTDISVRGNLIRDTNALGGGIAISNQAFVYDGSFSPLAGTTTVAQNTLVRTGAINPNWGHPMSAIRFDSYDFPITSPVAVTDNRFVDSPYSAFQFVSGSGTGKPITGVTVEGASVEGVGTVVLQVEAPGSGRFNNVVASRVGTRGFYNCVYPSGAGTFAINRGSGNSGWDTQWTDCGSWPPRNAGDTTTPPTTTPPQTGNVARGKAVSASSQVGGYPSSNTTDGNADSYWESNNNAFPQTLTVDLGASTSVRRLVLKLPPATAWGARTQTFSVLSSGDGSGFSQVLGSAGYRFDPASGNQVTVAVTANQRYLRLNFTGNTGWPAGQLSELEAYTS
ncbi:discoidin domain-containing protein [Umezawaea sp. Da 62-37]|uniref:discoidin domain-containing protein n=1 Tax=Umezawaea sp. Da 62-37 TaxID=3075927 RepID=UPI0028F70F44|nr:discoidin domain-containing protein [Umezawaea sp. Da 62-37]WNV84109.1 discoidin domain-containing protein [Umezawaea sp. Da 62-37]